MKFIINAIIFSIFLLNIISAQNITESNESNESNEAELLERILKDYNPNYLQNDNATEVQVNLFVRQISDFDIIKMEYTCQITFRMQWIDKRLKYNDTSISYLILRNEDSIFVPDIFFSSSKGEDDFNLIKPNVLIRIYPSGQILYSKRIKLILTCPLNLAYFPFDKQECMIKMASYAYTTDTLILLWKENNPVQITQNLNLPNYLLKQFNTGYSTSKTNTGEYSAINLSLFLERESSYYLITIFIPSTMLVIISWLSFFFSPKDQLIKVMICLVSLLLLVLGAKDLNNLTPQVSYIKASDVWIGTCLTFVFAALIESVIAYKMYNDKNSDQEEIPPNENSPVAKCFKLNTNVKAFKLEKIDFISLILFPIVFIIFVIFYLIIFCFN